MGLGGLKNGELLSAAEVAGFDVLITGDKLSNTNRTCKTG